MLKNHLGVWPIHDRGQDAGGVILHTSEISEIFIWILFKGKVSWIAFKGTVSTVLNEPPCTDGNAWFKLIGFLTQKVFNSDNFFIASCNPEMRLDQTTVFRVSFWTGHFHLCLRSITWSYVYNIFTKYLSGRDSNWTSQSNTKLRKRGRSNRSIPHSTYLQQLGLGTFQLFQAVPLKVSSNC